MAIKATMPRSATQVASSRRVNTRKFCKVCGGDDPYFYKVADAIEKHLGWSDEKAREAGDYVKRIAEVGRELKRLRKHVGGPT